MITIISGKHRFKRGDRPWRYFIGLDYCLLERLLIIYRGHSKYYHQPYYKVQLRDGTYEEFLDQYLFATRKEAEEAMIAEMQNRVKAYENAISRCQETIELRQHELEFLKPQLQKYHHKETK